MKTAKIFSISHTNLDRSFCTASNSLYLAATSKLLTPMLNINHKCLADGSVLLLTSSYT